MMKNSKQEVYSSKLIDDLFDSISDAEFEKTEKKMLLAAKIEDAMKARGWRKKDLLEKLGKKNPSIITRWFSGTHNFTVDTLIDLEQVLEIKLLEVGDIQEEVVASYKAEVHQSESLNVSINWINDMIKNSNQSGSYVYLSSQKAGPYSNQIEEA